MAPAASRSIAERARDVGLNSARLTRAFRRYVGMAPHAYVVRCRLAAAAELLDAGMSVSETCFRSGFENLSHFCRAFQRRLGVRASMWRTLGRDEKRRKVRQLSGRLF
jgi:AraC-like DNA-binding protein